MMHLSQQQQKLKDSIRNEDEANNGGDGQQGGKWGAGKNDGDHKVGHDKGGDPGADGDDTPACLIDPSTGKKMTKKRMQQLA